MAKTWDDIRARMSHPARARVDTPAPATLQSLPLAELRKAAGLTQIQLAEVLRTGQGSVSKIENAADMYVSTLRRFVEALGGELTLSATFPDGRTFVIERVAAVTDDEPQSQQQPA